MASDHPEMAPRLLGEAIVRIAEAAGVHNLRHMTGPQLLDLADQTAARVATLRALDERKRFE